MERMTATSFNDVVIVIPNYNGKAFISGCLNSIRNQTYRYSSTIVVDNGSTDGSVEYIRQNFDWVNVVPLNENRGYAGGVNEGIRLALESRNVEQIGIINNDAVMERNWLEVLLAFMEKNPAVASCQGKVLFTTSKRINTLGISPLPDGSALNLGIGLDDRSLPDFEVFGVSGAAALYRVAAMREAGLFDDEFFAYMEDVDMAWRLRLHGWKSFLVGDAIVHHVHSLSSRSREFKLHLITRNSNYVLMKNLPIAYWVLYPFSFMKYRVGASLTRKERFDALTDKLSVTKLLRILTKANAESVLSLPSMLMKRRNLRKAQNVLRGCEGEWLRRFSADIGDYLIHANDQ